MINSEKFRNPDKRYYPRSLWFWNDKPNEKNISEVIDSALDTGYGGFGILPYDACELSYMEDEYLKLYSLAAKKAKEKGLKLCLYDEWWFPSGSAGGLLKKYYPDACAKRLDMYEYPCNSDGSGIDITIPDGTLQSVVAYNKDTLNIINLMDCVKDGKLVCDNNLTGYTVLVFVCVLSDWDHVNYLDPEAVKKFIDITHEKYFSVLGEYFGDVIDSSFYDEPQMYALGGRMWTDDFNDSFKEIYGFTPECLYPALWYDIGDKTASYRNMLLTVHADLYSKGFPKVINEWCRSHGIKLTGHVDQEEMINPCGITGDLMKSFKYQDIPGFDEIMAPRRGKSMYKIVSSSAYNWDKSLVMSECFGAMDENISIETMYDEAMEQYAKGMNLLVPHAVWLNPSREKIIFHPELSDRNRHFESKLKPFNLFCARTQSLLQDGRHVSDIAVLYPIHGLQSAYYFDWGGNPYHGGPSPEYADYMKIGDILSEKARRDYTFIHPEVLAECKINGDKIRMDNEINHEELRVLILPGSDTIDIRSLKNAHEFYLSGGKVIFTSHIPIYCVESIYQSEMNEILDCMFSQATKENGYEVTSNEWGGKAIFVSDVTDDKICEILSSVLIDSDVIITAPSSDGLVSYIHKSYSDSEIYYIVNCNDDDISMNVSIRKTGEKYEIWNPHTGETNEITDIRYSDDRVSFDIKLTSHESRFIVVTDSRSEQI